MKKNISIKLCGLIIHDINEIEENVVEIQSLPNGMTSTYIKNKLDEILVKHCNKIAYVLEVEITENNTLKIRYKWNEKNDIKFVDHSKETLRMEQEELLNDIHKKYKYIKTLENIIKTMLLSNEKHSSIWKEEEYWCPSNQTALPFYKEQMDLCEINLELRKNMNQYIHNYEKYHVGDKEMYRKMKKWLLSKK